MNNEIKKMIETYQCPGCACDGNISCYRAVESGDGIGCIKHVAGTRIVPNIGRIFSGLPAGFCRLAFCEETKINIFEKFEDGWGYDMFNVPVWKHLDKNGNTLVRGLCPRTNYPWIHIFMGDQMSKIDCMVITQKDIDEMD